MWKQWRDQPLWRYFLCHFLFLLYYAFNSIVLLSVLYSFSQRWKVVELDLTVIWVGESGRYSHVVMAQGMHASPVGNDGKKGDSSVTQHKHAWATQCFAHNLQMSCTRVNRHLKSTPWPVLLLSTKDESTDWAMWWVLCSLQSDGAQGVCSRQLDTIFPVTFWEQSSCLF